MPQHKGAIPWNKGKKASKETKKRMSIAKLLNPTRYWLGKKRPEILNEKNPAWKGDKAGVDALHYWVKRRLGNPKKCEHCDKPNKIQNGQPILEWANKSRKYKRDLTDWIGLCSKCHSYYDKKHEQIPWNRRIN